MTWNALLQVTPNGPYGKDVHPGMPVTIDELIADVRACFERGARGVHLHVRDDRGSESLDPRHVNPTVAAVRALADDLGTDVEVGLTTGAWIVPDLAERRRMIRDWEGVDCATVNLSEDGFEAVMETMLAAAIGIDVGLWDISEIPSFAASGFADRVARVSIELDPGPPYFPTGDPAEVARRLNDALDAIGSVVPRLTHGAGDWTWPLVRDAFRRGHATRVGFEDSTVLPDGTVASSNAALVEAAAALAAKEIE